MSTSNSSPTRIILNVFQNREYAFIDSAGQTEKCWLVELEFFQRQGLDHYDSPGSRTQSWVMVQFRIQIEAATESQRSEFSGHVNLKLEFARIKGVRPCGVKRALALAGLELVGRHHRAIDDARNIVRLAASAILPARSTTRWRRQSRHYQR